jgi:hypothetical protein
MLRRMHGSRKGRASALFCFCLLAFLPAAVRAQTPAGFSGTYSIELPERVGEKTPLVKWQLSCEGTSCTLAIAGDQAEVFDRLQPATRQDFEYARNALRYARQHKDAAEDQAPHLMPLLDSASDLHSCIDLGFRKPRSPDSEQAGYTLLCKPEHTPWHRPVVLIFGTVLANCGPLFCRYEIVPLFKQ